MKTSGKMNAGKIERLARGIMVLMLADFFPEDGRQKRSAGRKAMDRGGQ